MAEKNRSSREMEYKLCECGCGKKMPKYRIENGRVRREREFKYIRNHQFNDPKIIKKLREGQLGEKNSFYGKKHKEETKKKWGEDRLGKDYVERFGEKRAKEICKKVSIGKTGKGSSLKGRTYEEIHGEEGGRALRKVRSETMGGENSPLRGKKRSKKSILKGSISMKKKWKDPEFIVKTLKAQQKARYQKPSGYEQKISELCMKYSLPFIYTGDGTFLIGRKIPDFINKEKRIAIEVFYSYHKKQVFGSVKNYMKERSKYFKKYGYKIIFLDEKIMKRRNWETFCVNKIKKRIKQWQ